MGVLASGHGLPPGFLGVAFASTERGKALVMRVENESIIIRLVFGGGL